MKRKSLSLALVLAMVLLMSFGIVAHAETTTGNAKDILLTDGERTFESDGETILEEGWLKATLKVNPSDEVSKITYVFDDGLDSENMTVLTDDFENNIKIQKEFAIGTLHTLRCVAEYTDGSSLEKSYIFKSVTRHENYEQLCMNVRLNNECMYQRHYYTVKKGDIISIDVETFDAETPVDFTGYYWADANTLEGLTEISDFNGEDGNYLEVEIPEDYYGTRKALIVETVLTNNEKSGWLVYYLNFGNDVSVTAKINDKDISAFDRCIVKSGDKITVFATPMVDSEISFIGYYYAADNPYRFLTDIIDIDGDKAEIILPDEEPGTELLLYIEPVDMLDDGRISFVTKTGWQEYTLVWGEDTLASD